jgi:hypothetical protein
VWCFHVLSHTAKVVYVMYSSVSPDGVRAMEGPAKQDRLSHRGKVGSLDPLSAMT